MGEGRGIYSVAMFQRQAAAPKPRTSRCEVRSFFARVSHWRYSAFLTPAEQAVSHVFELAWMGPFFSHSEVLALKPGFLAAVQTLGGKAAH